MALSTPQVKIIGHSFVRRLKSDLRVQFDERASKNIGHCEFAVVHMHGVGGYACIYTALGIAHLRNVESMTWA